MLHKTLTILIALVWLANGLFCKVLNLVPRHQEIVATILGVEHARIITILIGISEIAMAIWIISRYKSKINAWFQIVIILTMNILEFTLAGNLLLWGKANIIFAIIFCGIIYYNEFGIKARHNTIK